MKNSRPEPIGWFIAIGYVLIIVMLVSAAVSCHAAVSALEVKA